VANRIIEIREDGTWVDRAGTYEEFIEWRRAQGESV